MSDQPINKQSDQTRSTDRSEQGSRDSVMNDASNRTERGELSSRGPSTSTPESGAAGRQSSGLERNAPEGADACEPATDASTRSERGGLYSPADVASSAAQRSMSDAASDSDQNLHDQIHQDRIVAAAELHDLNGQLRELSIEGRFTEKLQLAKSELGEVQERLNVPRGYDTRGVDEQARSDLERSVEVTERQLSVPEIKDAVETALREELGDRLKSVSVERNVIGTFFTFNAKIAVEKHQAMGMGRDGPHFHSYAVDRDVRVGGYNAEENKFFTNDELEQMGEPGLISEGLGPIGYAMDIGALAALGKLVGRAAVKTVGRRFVREAGETLGDDAIEALGREGDDAIDDLAAKADDVLAKGDLGSDLSVPGDDGASLAHLGEDGAEGAGRQALSSTEQVRVQQIDQRLGSLRGEINAERVRLGEVRERVGEAAWSKVRAGETKKYYNMLEERAVLNLQKTFPDRTFLGQVEVVGIRQPDGHLLRTGKIADKGRIADWAELTENGVRLGEFKSSSEVTRSVAGGMKRSPGIEAKFRSSSSLGGQIDVERQVIGRAQESGGKIVIRGTDPLTGETIERAVSPDALRMSGVGDYNRSGAPRN